MEQAAQVASVLQQQSTFHVVVSSPYLRCVQTALVIAEQLDIPVLLDEQLGEVLGPHVFGDIDLKEMPWRSVKLLCQALTSEGTPGADRIKGTRLLGQGTSEKIQDARLQWPEGIKEARQRYARRTVDYLRRARRTKRNSILVTHGHMVEACLRVFPATCMSNVSKVGFCGFVLGVT